MSNFKLCILAAGKGTRNQSIEGLHKCLLPVGNKPVISHILDRFPKHVPVIIALGWKAQQVKTYVNKVHADRDITYVEVDNFENIESSTAYRYPGPAGPGYSLLSCEEYLDSPFIFTAADTIIDPGISFKKLNKDWVGVCNVKEDESHKYCLVKISENKLLEKFYYGCGKNSLAFTGIAGIHDYKTFWKSLHNSYTINGEHQVLNGFDELENIHIKKMNWHDTGNEESYEKTKEIYPNNIAIEKDNEAIFIDNGYVIKYFSNKSKSQNRIKRHQELTECVPKICKINENMFCYKFIDGEKLSDIQDDTVLRYFFNDYEKKFRKQINDFDSNFFKKNCQAMYKEKTTSRIKSFIGSPIDNIKIVNGIHVETIEEMISKINWDKIYEQAIPSRFHGDMQPENIIIDSQNKFYYIDWRESFGLSLDVGDAYYDLGKLYHALVISNSLILGGNYEIRFSKNQSKAEIQFSIKNNLNNLISHLKNYCEREGYSFKHVRLIGILNYLNIACLYSTFNNGKYGDFLFLLGKKMLSELFSEGYYGSK